MSKTLRVPDPVYEAIEREARRRDVARGIVVRDWMQQAQTEEDNK